MYTLLSLQCRIRGLREQRELRERMAQRPLMDAHYLQTASRASAFAERRALLKQDIDRLPIRKRSMALRYGQQLGVFQRRTECELERCRGERAQLYRQLSQLQARAAQYRARAEEFRCRAATRRRSLQQVLVEAIQAEDAHAAATARGVGR